MLVTENTSDRATSFCSVHQMIIICLIEEAVLSLQYCLYSAGPIGTSTWSPPPVFSMSEFVRKIAVHQGPIIMTCLRDFRKKSIILDEGVRRNMLSFKTPGDFCYSDCPLESSLRLRPMPREVCLIYSNMES